MNRRSFLSSIFKGAAGFTILPGAGRIWKVQAKLPRFEPWDTPEFWKSQESPYFKYLPSFQDFLAAFLRSPKTEAQLIAELFDNPPKIWPPNMGETTRIICNDTNYVTRGVVQSPEPNSRPIYVGAIFPS